MVFSKHLQRTTNRDIRLLIIEWNLNGWLTKRELVRIEHYLFLTTGLWIYSIFLLYITI